MFPDVAVTGLGVIAPGGIGAQAYWDLLSSGRTSTRQLSFFDPTPFRSRVVAECDFSPDLHGLTPQQVQQMDRVTQFAVAATREAIADSGLEISPEILHRCGVSMGSAVGCTTSLENTYVDASSRGRDWLVSPEGISPALYDHFIPSSICAEVAWEAGAQGPVTMISTGCTSGIDAVGFAWERIRSGDADVMITGAAEAPISPITVACFDAIRATTPDNDSPECASRPFDLHRNGFVLGEGAAVLVLERMEHARARGAHVYALISGFASRCNAFHMTGLRPDGAEMADAISCALKEARVRPEEVDYINAHGSGTRQNDRHETAAFKRALGRHAYSTPISSIKSMIGHSLGAIGSLEIAACALAMENDVIPPTANLRTPDPECDLDYVPLVARAQRTDVALTVGSGFGGFQSAMVLARPARTAS
ncbi:beta-ketoacyl-[acyl-carrier-protein] synthase family protein [Streptomyces sp. NPDC056480]|uniref:beta-ketoacyl-[acyl-carrier-protein] synthase family protein n=1 Tax=Streptomyces sp. NPDC056480 TaxID=3345833 RepID=UPI00369919E7